MYSDQGRLVGSVYKSAWIDDNILYLMDMRKPKEQRTLLKMDPMNSGVFIQLIDNEKIAKDIWPGPLTVIVKKRENSNIRKETIGEVIGFNRIKNSEACEFVSSITGDNSREVVSFGTEAGLFQEIGISTAVCGPGSIEQAHKVDEFIKLEEINKCLEFLDGVKNQSTSS